MGVTKKQVNGLDDKATPVVLPSNPGDISLDEAVVANPLNGDAVAMTNPPEVRPGVEKGATQQKREERGDDEMDI
jgi:hypothetical protein